jgi:general secretion pathway protein G
MLLRQAPRIVQKSAVVARSGFTLMEILIVVAIIVVLAGVGTFYLIPMLGGAKDDVAKAQAKTISEACQAFFANNSRLPQSLQELTTRQPNGKGALLEPDAIMDPWDKLFQYDPSGQMNDGNKPDVWTVSPEGKRIGNWSKLRQ